MAPRKRRRGPRFLSSREINSGIQFLVDQAKKEGVRVALLGGAAMNFYGSPRMTSDVDFAADDGLPPGDNFEHVSELTFGGERYIALGDVPIDLIVRKDEYAPLYQEALDRADETDEGFLIISPEYLAVMKFATKRAKDENDLLWLLAQDDLVDVKAAEEIVRTHLGGPRTAREFRHLLNEARWRASEGEFDDKLDAGEEE